MAVASETRRMKSILKCLEHAYGERELEPGAKPVDALIRTILSQNTSRANSAAGFTNLKEAFDSWDQVADATESAIGRCIEVSGLSGIKAPRIRAILRQIRSEHGSISLQFLGDRQPSEAYDYLMRFSGVGPKTAWCTLMFAFGMQVFPVDTHIHRIAIRLGLIEARTSAEKSHDLLAPMIAPADRYAMHVLLIAHGRRICLARRPRCENCCILKFCPHGGQMLEERLDR